MTRTFVARPTPADVAAVTALAPLAAGLNLRCGPFLVPTAVLASVATLESEDSEAAAVARAFVAEDPWAGMGSVRRGGWMLLARGDDTIVIGRRRGPVGLHAVVTLTRDGGRFDARSMGGWQLALPDPSEQAETVGLLDATENTIELEWDCGQNLDGRPDRVFSRVELRESADEVHLLLLSVARPTPPGPDGIVSHVGTGMAAWQTIRLGQPLGRRRLLNDARVPPDRLEHEVS